MKEISTGGLTFAEIRDEGMYYVDKSLLIKDILDADRRGVHLFTRPRRFGKSTNLSMLDAFFNMKYKGNTWFDDLEISKYPEYGKYKNAFPVIYLNLKEAEVSTYEDFVSRIRVELCKAYEENSHLIDVSALTISQDELFQSTIRKKTEEVYLRDCVPLLCELIHKSCGVRPIILIDEYDRAVSDAFGSESHEPMMKLLGRIMSAALKSNEHLQMAVVTGIMQIAKESIFSGLNNLNVNNIFSKMSDERYGFTEDEVKRIISDYGGTDDEFKEAKEWYDGYRFGDAEVYNPFSVMYYVSKGFKSASYWTDSGADVLIHWLLDRTDSSTLSSVMALLEGNSLQVPLNISFPYKRVNPDLRTLFNLMAMSGYLKAVPVGERRYEITIPNKEANLLIDDVLYETMPLDTMLFVDFCNAVLEGDPAKMEKQLLRALTDSSYLNLKDENAYEILLLTMMHALAKRYHVKSECEEGNGRVDIVMTPRNENDTPMIFELKHLKPSEHKESELDGALDDAMRQIHEKRYYLGMKGRVPLIAIAFLGKIPKVRIETIDNGDGHSYERTHVVESCIFPTPLSTLVTLRQS